MTADKIMKIELNGVFSSLQWACFSLTDVFAKDFFLVC